MNLIIKEGRSIIQKCTDDIIPVVAIYYDRDIFEFVVYRFEGQITEEIDKIIPNREDYHIHADDVLSELKTHLKEIDTYYNNILERIQSK